ncbi:cell division protein FtsL [Cytobacillus firmus]|uniref:Cell division protein FtsL n=1 Tax=Cytobacillus firmus DS1 TaxID=1307436 RepID=W7LIE5_CYTFI|nr:cell division protein FtsL [Cytobacillus firmus]EWG11849.1 cell division protein FtsL [Cytobacillus firmus DS1]
MSNLARKIQEDKQFDVQTQPVQAPKKLKSKKSWLSPGEKILGLAFTGIVCFGAVQMVSNQAAIYEVNKEIQQTEEAIQTQNKVNTDLKMQVSELSTYERIKAKAEEMGLKFSGNNVKVVED